MPFFYIAKHWKQQSIIMNNSAINTKLLSLLETIPLPENSVIEQYRLFMNAYHEIIRAGIALMVSDEFQLFASDYASWTFLTQRNPEYAPASKAYSMFKKKLKHQELYFQDIKDCFELTVFIISCLADKSQEIPHILNDYHQKEIEGTKPLYRGYVLSITKIHDTEFEKEYHLLCRDDQGIESVVILKGQIALSARYIWVGATVHIFSLTASIENDSTVYRTTPESLFVLEPDILISATVIAECSQHNHGISLALYILKSFFEKKP